MHFERSDKADDKPSSKVPNEDSFIDEASSAAGRLSSAAWKMVTERPLETGAVILGTGALIAGRRSIANLFCRNAAAEAATLGQVGKLVGTKLETTLAPEALAVVHKNVLRTASAETAVIADSLIPAKLESEANAWTYRLTSGEKLGVRIPTQKDLLGGASYDELTATFRSNQKEIVQLFERQRDQIPFIGFHGCNDVKFQHLAKQIQTPRGQSFLIATFEHRGGTAEEFATNVARAASDAAGYTTSKRLECAGVEMAAAKQGPLLVMKPETRGLDRMIFVRHRSRISMDGYWPDATCNGEKQIALNNESLNQVCGYIQPERYAHLDIRASQIAPHLELEKYARINLGMAFKKQVLVLDSLKHLGLLL